jgi:hypothetical protein
MAFVNTPDAAKVIISYGVPADDPLSNTLWFVRPGFTFAEMQALADFVGLWWLGNILPELSQFVQYHQTQVYDMRALDGATYVSLQGANTPGTYIEGISNIGTSVVATFRTSSRGRSARGRNYVRGWSENRVAARTVEATATQAVADAYVDLLVLNTPPGWTPVVRSGQQDGVKLLEAVTRPIISAEVRNQTIASQRRSIRRP